jgi:A/G-specific adenine glycosylase
LPWRRSAVSPFHLLLAEVLLVQTKAEDVARVWPKLAKTCRSPEALAATRKQTLVGLLRPLGLQNQRAASLKRICNTIIADFGGKLPSTLKGLLLVPHVGLYTAAAVACFKFGERVPIVDANVMRVLGRIVGKSVVKDLRRSKEVWTWAWALLPRKNCSQHNYGILDFASLVCTPQKPHCERCPLCNDCSFGQQQLVATRVSCEKGGLG